MVIREDEIDMENIEELADIYSSVIPGTKLELVTETKRWVEIVKKCRTTFIAREFETVSQLENLFKH